MSEQPADATNYIYGAVVGRSGVLRQPVVVQSGIREPRATDADHGVAVCEWIGGPVWLDYLGEVDHLLNEHELNYIAAHLAAAQHPPPPPAPPVVFVQSAVVPRRRTGQPKAAATVHAVLATEMVNEPATVRSTCGRVVRDPKPADDTGSRCCLCRNQGHFHA